MSKTADESRTALGSSASHDPGTLKAHSSNSDPVTGMGRPVARGLNENRVEFSCVDANADTSSGRLVARIAADHSSRTLNSQGLTGNVGYSRDARSFRFMKILLRCSRNSLCPASPECGPKADSRWKDSFSAAQIVKTTAVFFFSKTIFMIS